MARVRQAERKRPAAPSRGGCGFLHAAQRGAGTGFALPAPSPGISERGGVERITGGRPAALLQPAPDDLQRAGRVDPAGVALPTHHCPVTLRPSLQTRRRPRCEVLQKADVVPRNGCRLARRDRFGMPRRRVRGIALANRRACVAAVVSPRGGSASGGIQQMTRARFAQAAAPDATAAGSPWRPDHSVVPLPIPPGTHDRRALLQSRASTRAGAQAVRHTCQRSSPISSGS